MECVLAREKSLCRGMTQGRKKEHGAFDELTKVQCDWSMECKAEGVAGNAIPS